MVSGFEDNPPGEWANLPAVDLFLSGDRWTAEAIYPDESFSVTAGSPGDAIEELYVLITNTDTL